MSTGVILTVLSNVPWGKVIENAPKVAEGATRLWDSVAQRRRKAPSETGAVPAQAAGPGAGGEPLRAQVQALEAEVQKLSEQMQASSGLIKALAEQNAQLVQRVELNRIRLWRVGLGACAAVLLLAAGLAYMVFRA